MQREDVDKNNASILEEFWRRNNGWSTQESNSNLKSILVYVTLETNLGWTKNKKKYMSWQILSHAILERKSLES